MAEWHFQANTANELDQQIRNEIAALENLGKGDEIHGTLHVTYSDEAVKKASLIPWLNSRDVAIKWNKT